METASAESYQQLRHLRMVASASTLTLLFAHEVRTVIGALGASSARLEQLAKLIPRYASDLNALGSQLVQTKERFDNLVAMTGIVGAFKADDQLTDLHLKTAVELRATQCFHLRTSNYSILVDDRDIPTNLTVGPMIEGELYTILLTLLELRQIGNCFRHIPEGDQDRR